MQGKVLRVFFFQPPNRPIVAIVAEVDGQVQTLYYLDGKPVELTDDEKHIVAQEENNDAYLQQRV